jgi:Xaa-Pro aminopeptidase
VAILKKLGLEKGLVGVVGLEPYPPFYFDGAMPYNTWKTVLDSLPEARFKPVQRQFIHMTAARSAEELEVLKWSVQVGEKMCVAMRDATRPGAAEGDIYSAVMEACPKNACFTGEMLLGSGPEYYAWGLPTWAYRPHAPRTIREGDAVLAEVFCSLGMLETQHQPTIAVGKMHPDFDRAERIARESYEIGLGKLRPGVSFKEVVEAMEEPVRRAGGWHVHPWIHSMNPFGLISGLQGLSKLPGADRYGRVGEVPLVGAEAVLQPGMTFAFEPNCGFGKHVANLGGTVVVGEKEGVELNQVATRVMRV